MPHPYEPSANDLTAEGYEARGRLRVDLKAIDELQPRDMHAWQRLAARASEPNPFFEAGFLLPALKHLATEGAVVTFVYDGDELIWAAPMCRRRRWRRISMPMVSTWCHTHCFFGAPLALDGRAEIAWRLVLDAVAAWSPRAHMLVLELMPIDGELFEALEGAAGSRAVRRYETYVRAVLRRDSLVGGTAPQRGRHRRELERRSRLVERETGAPFTTRDISGEPGAVEGFLVLEEQGWTGRAGTALASDPSEAAFALAAARSFQSEGRLVLLATTTGSGTAAELFAVRGGGTLFMFKIAFDEHSARFSPGTHLVRDMTRWFAVQSDLDRIDSCAVPENEFINRLLPDRRPLATVLVPLDPFGRVAAAVIPTLVNCRRTLRRWTRRRNR
jgi:CelD/BcsL family acetyltransferase involved in cellulose biosynthesis